MNGTLCVPGARVGPMSVGFPENHKNRAALRERWVEVGRGQIQAAADLQGSNEVPGRGGLGSVSTRQSAEPILPNCRRSV